MKFKKRMFVLLLCVFLSATSVNGIFADNSNNSYTLAYSVNPDGKSVTVTGFEVAPTEEYDLVIPRKVVLDGKSYLVTAIVDGEVDEGNNNVLWSPFGGTRANGVTVANRLMKSVTLPNTLEEIGDGAFLGCVSLTEVKIPESVKRIGRHAFRFCSNIRTFNVLPDNLELIDTAAFSAVDNLGGVVSIPGNAALSSNTTVRTVETTFVTENSKGSILVLGEGINETRHFCYNCSYLDTLILPSTFSRTVIDPFSRGDLKRLSNVYILSKDFTWNSNKAINVNSSNSVPATWYVASDSVKETLMECGISEENIKQPEGNYIVYNEGFDVTVVDTAQEINLYEPEHDGYKFKYWTDGEGTYAGGETYFADKSVVLTAVWERITEDDTVLYKKVDSDGGEVTLNNEQVNRIYSSQLVGQTAEVVLTDETGFEESFVAEFDDNGMWFNNGNDSVYTKAVVNGTDSFAVLNEANSDFEAVIGLREPSVIAYPRISGSIDLSGFDWTSSDMTVAQVDNGIVTGYKTGSCVISASSDGVNFEIPVIVKGEIAEAIENGTEEEYIREKKPVIDEMNRFIAERDVESLVDFLMGKSSVKLSDIKDINTELFETSEYDYMAEMANRMISLGKFTFEEISDVDKISSMLALEYETGKLNGISNTDEVKRILEEKNSYYKLPLDNKYYLRYCDEVLEAFTDYTVVNSIELLKDFKNEYTMAAFRNAQTYSSLATVLEDCAEEIAYDIQTYEEKKSSDFHKSLIQKRETILSTEDICDFIDSYKASSDNNSSGSSGSGTRNSGGSVKSISSSIAVNKAEQIAESTTPLYSDVEPNRWSYDSIAYLNAKGVISGYSDGRFNPEGYITRAEFVKIISVSFGLTLDTESLDEGEALDMPYFEDVSEDKWFYPYVMGAAYYGVLSESPNFEFNPDRAITRQEAAAVIYRAAVAKNIEFTADQARVLNDYTEIDDWAYTPVMRLVGAGIINGYSDGTFKPNNPITREESAKIIAQILKGNERSDVK